VCSYKGIFVTRVKEESPAAGIVPLHARLYAINDHDVTNATKKECMEFIKQTGSLVRLVISVEPDESGFKAFEAGLAPPPKAEAGSGGSHAGLVRKESDNSEDPYALIAPISTSPEIERQSVQIKKGKDKLGVSICGPRGDNSGDPRVGCWITKVKETSPAHGILFPQMRVFGVDGSDLTDGNKIDCIECLKASGETLTMEVSSAPDEIGFKYFEQGVAPAEQSLTSPKPEPQAAELSLTSPEPEPLAAEAVSYHTTAGTVAVVNKRTVQVDKSKNGGKLGVNLCGPKAIGSGDVRVGIWVSKVSDTSPAQDILAKKMRVYEIDGEDLTDATKDDCVNCIKGSGDLITFVVSDGPDEDGWRYFREGVAPPVRAAAPTPTASDAEEQLEDDFEVNASDDDNDDDNDDDDDGDTNSVPDEEPTTTADERGGTYGMVQEGSYGMATSNTGPGPGKTVVTVDTRGGKLGMSIAGPRDEADPRKG